MNHLKVASAMLSLDDDAVKAWKFVTARGYTFPEYLRTGDLPAAGTAKGIRAESKVLDLYQVVCCGAS